MQLLARGRISFLNMCWMVINLGVAQYPLHRWPMRLETSTIIDRCVLLIMNGELVGVFVVSGGVGLVCVHDSIQA